MTTADDLRNLAELYLYDGDTDQPLNDGYGALICLADQLDSVATNESALTTIVRVLSETYTDAGVLIWLNAKNKQLLSQPGGNWRCTPAEYIASGHAAEVLECARRIEAPW